MSYLQLSSIVGYILTPAKLLCFSWVQITLSRKQYVQQTVPLQPADAYDTIKKTIQPRPADAYDATMKVY